MLAVAAEVRQYRMNNCDTFFHDLVHQRINSACVDVVKLLVGNKVDQNRVVSREQAEEWAKARGMLFAESSAKTTEGVSQVFSEVVQQVSYESPSNNLNFFCW